MFVDRFSPLRFLALAAGLHALSGVAPAVAQVARPATALAVDEMSRAAGGEVSATVAGTGLVTFLRTQPGAPIPLGRPGSAEERAREFLASYGRAFGVGRGAELETLRVSALDEVGMEHVRFQQTHRGIPVTGGELTVHLRGRGVVAANANTLPGLESVETVPAITAAEAAILARDALEQGLGVTGATLGEPRLELLNRRLLGGTGFATELAWFVEARKIDLREYLWIDARAGKVALQFSQLTHARNRQVWDAAGTSTFEPGAPARAEGGAPAGGAGGADVDAAYDYSGDTYDYFSGHHGRDSYDDAGAALKSTVRYCPTGGSCPYANAFWNGERMAYGEGFAQADDVAAHELTHAVTEHTAGLFYYMQSGALNEAYSDIFGETVDLLNGAGTDASGVRWQMGEDVPGLGAIRDLSDPTLFGDPGKTSDPEFACGDDYRSDRGGVHSNSGVPNKAYYLMADGDTFNGQTVSGIGLAKAGKVQYRALSRYLLSASDFRDNDLALRQSCQDLIGASGITAGDCSQVAKALDAVEMNQTWPCSPTQAAVPAYCPAGQAPDLWYYQDFEGSTGLASCPSTGVPSAWCIEGPSSLLGAFATSGERSLWGYNRRSSGTLWTTKAFADPLPPEARMQFNHSHGFDNNGGTYFDGGHVAVSDNGGASYMNAQWFISAGDAYGGPLSDCCGNPYGGLDAIVGDSWGYTASQLDLSSLAGTPFAYAFIVATDSAIDEYGWFIDDVRIYTCPACLTDRILDGGYTGTAPHYAAADSITAGDGFTVQAGEDVTFEAGGSVVLTDGFRAAGDFTVITGSGSCALDAALQPD